MTENIQYMTEEKKTKLEQEKNLLKDKTLPELAKRIDDARQMGDLSENAEYHQAREDLAWAQSRILELDSILDNSAIFDKKTTGTSINLGSVVVVKITETGKEKILHLVGAQEVDPLAGKISNESPLGSALLGKKAGDTVKIKVPAGEQSYFVKSVS